MANGMDNAGYDQLFGLIEDVREEASRREIAHAEWRGMVSQQLKSMPCASHRQEIEAMRKDHTALENRVNMAIAASRPWANLLMSLLGGLLGLLVAKVVHL